MGLGARMAAITLGNPTGRSFRGGLVGIIVAATFVVAPAASGFFQAPGDASPATGTARIIAQGVEEIGAGDLRWQVSSREAPPPANAEPVDAGLGFLAVSSGVMLVESDQGDQQRLAAGEAMLSQAGEEQLRVAIGSDAASYLEITLAVAADTPADGDATGFLSEPFPGLDARHDIELLGDSIGPGLQLAIPAGAAPTLVVVEDGAINLAADTGDVISLGAQEAASVSGAVTLTAGDAGARILAAYVGPSVPTVARGAGTPRPSRSVEPSSDAEAAQAATPAATVAAPAAGSPDGDGDGIEDGAEAEIGTDPALADTDEDGLTDGQEADEFGSDPLMADTDADGVLDGDEVAQGTSPIEAGASAPPDEESTQPEEAIAPAEEASAPEESVAEPTTPGDSEGDGLEDAIEAELGTDPFDVDTDDDGLSDGDEYYVYATGTRNPDSDGDAVLDGDEVANGTDPNVFN